MKDFVKFLVFTGFVNFIKSNDIFCSINTSNSLLDVDDNFLSVAVDMGVLSENPKWTHFNFKYITQS